MNAFWILETMLYFLLKQMFSCKAIYLPHKKIKAGCLMHDLTASFLNSSVTLGFLEDSFTVPQNHILKFMLGWVMLLFGLCSVIPNWMDLRVLLRDQIAFGGQTGVTLLIQRTCLTGETKCECKASVSHCYLGSASGCAGTSSTCSYRSPCKSIAINAKR